MAFLPFLFKHTRQLPLTGISASLLWYLQLYAAINMDSLSGAAVELPPGTALHF